MTTNQNVDPLVAFEWVDYDAISIAVVTAVAAASGQDPVTTAPLYEVIDPEALDSVFAGTGSSETGVNGCVQFEYEGYRVVVESSGRGYVYE